MALPSAGDSRWNYAAEESVCETCFVPTGLANQFHLTRHCRAALSHDAATRLLFCYSCSTFAAGN